MNTTRTNIAVRPSARAEQVCAYRPNRPLGPIDLWLDANEGPAQRGNRIVIDAETARRYPDATPLEERLADWLGIERDRVLVTAGADDAINRLCLGVLEEGRGLLQHTPTFTMIEHSATLAGASVRGMGWVDGPFPIDAMLDAIDDSTGLVAVVTPNNPTGAAVALDDLSRLAEACAGVGAVLMVDLAYAEFASEDPTPALLSMPAVVVVRTFSKAHSMAGLRVGWLAGPPDVVEWCRRVGGPFPVSGASLDVATRLIDEGGDLGRSVVERVRRERSEISAVLRATGARPLPSDANFVLADFATPTRADWMRDALAGVGVAVRGFSRDELRAMLRITCPGDTRSMDRLVGALRSAAQPEALLLDMDGVIADVSASYRAAILETVGAFGGRADASLIAAAKRRGDANNDWVLTQRILATQGIDVPLERVTARFEEAYQGHAGCPGLRERETLVPTRATLEAIARRIPMAVVTGRPRDDARRFLERTGLTGLFETLVCMEDAPAKPAPDAVDLAMARLGVTRAWMVGDTVDDIRAARRATSGAVVPLGVVAPSDDREPTSQSLLRAGAGRVLSTLDDLLEVLP